MSEADPKPRPKWLKLTLALLPVWLVASAGVAIWWSLHTEEAKKLEQQKRFAQDMSVERIADDLRKFNEVIGPRHTRDAQASANLTRAASMIEGVLGPANTGYQVKPIAGPGAWPILRASLESPGKHAASYWVLCAYDSDPDQTAAQTPSSGVTAVIAAAQAMAADLPENDLHFIFLPHGHQPGAPVADTLGKLTGLMDVPPALVICVEDMARGPELRVLATETALEPMAALSGLGTLRAGESPLPGLAGHCQQAGLTAAAASSTAETGPTADRPAAAIAVNSGRLVEWLRRCTRLPQR